MRLAACALSAILLSGCSWMGIGGQSNGFGTSAGAYGAGCAPIQSGAYGQYGQAASYGGGYGFDASCAGGSYGVAPGFGAGGAALDRAASGKQDLEQPVLALDKAASYNQDLEPAVLALDRLALAKQDLELAVLDSVKALLLAQA